MNMKPPAHPPKKDRQKMNDRPSDNLPSAKLEVTGDLGQKWWVNGILHDTCCTTLVLFSGKMEMLQREDAGKRGEAE